MSLCGATAGGYAAWLKHCGVPAQIDFQPQRRLPRPGARPGAARVSHLKRAGLGRGGDALRARQFKPGLCGFAHLFFGGGGERTGLSGDHGAD